MAAALTLRTETGPLRPQFEHVVTSTRRAAKTGEDALSPRARQINERELRRFKLSWNDGSAGQRALLVYAHRDARGSILPMNYTPVGLTDSSALEVCFVENTLRISRVAPYRYAMDVEIEEVR